MRTSPELFRNLGWIMVHPGPWFAQGRKAILEICTWMMKWVYKKGITSWDINSPKKRRGFAHFLHCFVIMRELRWVFHSCQTMLGKPGYTHSCEIGCNYCPSFGHAVSPVTIHIFVPVVISWQQSCQLSKFHFIHVAVSTLCCLSEITVKGPLYTLGWN